MKDMKMKKMDMQKKKGMSMDKKKDMPAYDVKKTKKMKEMKK
jgi:hypothetical protein